MNACDPHSADHSYNAIGLARPKVEGAAIPYDTAPPGPPATWRELWSERLRELRYYLWRIRDAILNRESGY